MISTRPLIAALLCLVTPGCASMGAISGTKTAEITHKAQVALQALDYKCQIAEAGKEPILCEHKSTWKFQLEVRESSQPQLVLTAFFEAKEPCASMLAKLNELNWEQWAAQLSCKEDSLQLALSTTLPKRGYDASELDGLLKWWTLSGQILLAKIRK